MSNPEAGLSSPTDFEPALLVERHVAEFFRSKTAVPGVEVHVDPDVTWVVQPGRIWSNAGVMVRFTPESAERRLDTIIERYRVENRGMGFWISPAATPESLPRLLRARRFHCRKRFPAMVSRLAESRRPAKTQEDLEIRVVEDGGQFLKIPHPSIGPVTTPRRRHMWEHLCAMVAARPRRTFCFVAWMNGRPVGSSLLFMGSETSGLHDLSVLEDVRGRGIGAALLEHTCQEAARLGARTMVLLATGEGERLYARHGFEEVARFGYWFRSFQREG